MCFSCPKLLIKIEIIPFGQCGHFNQVDLLKNCDFLLCMIDYTSMQKLFMQLNVFNNPMKYWFDEVGWEITNCMCEQVLKRIQRFMVGSKFVSLNVHEITTFDN
jgi:hypothetical protein